MDGYGEVTRPGATASIGIGGVDLFGNKRPYIWITKGHETWPIGTLSPRVTPAKFWELIEAVLGVTITEAGAGR